MSASIKHADGLARCPWPKDDPLYVAYHDDEWGVPEYDDRALYEKLMLDGFQAGLSWITILRKRDNFRRAFDDFEPEKIARYTPKKVERLMQDAGIVRNRVKIEGTVLSARAWLDIMEKGPGFSQLLWDFCDGKPKVNNFRTTKQVPAETAVSRAISKELAGARLQVLSARPSSTPSCRRSAWSTTTWSPATATRRARSWRSEDAAMPRTTAQRTESRPTARLAAHAVGTPARPARSLAARRRDRGHRAWARARRALERPDQGRAYLLGGAAFPAGRDHRAPAARGSTAAGRLAVLLHDAPEYVIGDMISPFKAVIGDNYKAVEARLLAAIHLRFGLPAALSAELLALIKAADQGAAYLEATRLAGFTAAEARRFFGRPPALSAAIAARLPDALAGRDRRGALSRALCTTVPRLTLSRHRSAAHI